MGYFMDTLIFKGITDYRDVLKKANDFTEMMLSDFCLEEIENAIPFLPSITDGKLTYEMINNPDFHLSSVDNIFVQFLFRYNFIYWKKYKMLGVKHKMPKQREIETMGYICFQNSYDQNYDYEEWDVLLDNDTCRKEFADAINDTKAGKFDLQKSETDPAFINRKEEMDYDRKSKLYGIIENKLSINDIIYHTNYINTEEIETFCISPVITPRKQIELNTQTRCIAKAYIKKIHDLKE